MTNYLIESIKSRPFTIQKVIWLYLRSPESRITGYTYKGKFLSPFLVLENDLLKATKVNVLDSSAVVPCIGERISKMIQLADAMSSPIALPCKRPEVDLRKS